MKGNLNNKKLDALKPPAKGNLIIWDTNRDAPSGFGVRITAAGAVSFVLNYRNSYGTSRRYTIGQLSEFNLDDAREEASALRKLIKKGADPVREKQDERKTVKEPEPEVSAEKTVKDLAEAYMARHVMIRNGPDQKKNARYMINKVIIPRWGDRKLSTLTTGDVIDLHNEISARHRCTQCRAYYAAEFSACPECKSRERKPAGLYSANQVLTVIKAMFNKGIVWGMCATNPAAGIKRHEEDKRQTWLNETQLAALDNAITAYGKDSGELIRLLLLSGSRRGEWMRAKKEQFDMEHGVWAKPARTVKDRKQKYLQLNAATMAVLRRVIASTPASEPYLFPGRVAGQPREGVRRPWLQILKLAGLAQEYTKTGKRGPLKRWRPTIRLHDLRHSYASWLAEHGVPLFKIGKLLGHQQTGTTERYAHIADRSLLDASDMFGEMITKAVQ
jgi:integrase